MKEIGFKYMQNEAKNKIKDLVQKYEAVKSSGKIGKYTEEDTKKDFIVPFFEALGWDVYDRNEVTAEEHISGDRVDYGFYLNGQPKFYLEAKPLKADLFREEYAKQAIHYSWNKGVTWAVLSDFENLIIFNALSPEKSLAGKKYLSFTYEEYITRFDELWRLSKEAFGNDVLDKEAEKVGKKLQKVSVTETLSKDLNECREILTNSLSQFNEKVDPYLIDEGVQKLLNRLIFIRCAEDRKIEPPTLIPLVREWKSSGKAGEVSPYQAMIKKFRELDEVYNSNLFDEHPFEKWDEFGGATEKVIDILYGKKNYLEYDFSIIPADVLGNVYENYLGHQLKKSKKEEHLDKNLKKRKEQGIYYTPKFIVDYIVQNALGPVLDKCRSINDLQKVKVLDPACGSGSFLVAAMNFLIKKYKEFNTEPSGFLKIQILQGNIYGVDLDQQAVELARLNLLLNTFDGQIKLPGLENNIKNGNSLISGTVEELKKYFGKNYHDKKPFNWQEEFPEVFKQGGFDCIIGNPPYIRNRELPESDKKYFSDKFISAQGQYDIYQLFYEQAIMLLEDFGYLGFITSNKYAIADYGKKLREFILENCKIRSIVDVSNVDVFKEAATYPYIIILEKSKDNSNNSFGAYKVESEANLEKNKIIINQDEIKATSTKNFVLKTELPFLKKIENSSAKLGDIAVIKETIHTGNIREKLIVDKPEDKTCKKLLAGKDCHRYWFRWGGKYIKYDKDLIEKEAGDYANLPEPKYFENPKILLRDISKYPEAIIDEEKYYSVNTLYSIQLIKNNYDLYYILACLNSKLIRSWFAYKFEDAHVSGGFLRFKKIYTSQIPIREIDLKNKDVKAAHDSLASAAKNLTELYKKLYLTVENSDQWHKIKDEIAKTDKKIDEEVYKLYGLTKEEIKIVEAK